MRHVTLHPPNGKPLTFDLPDDILRGPPVKPAWYVHDSLQWLPRQGAVSSVLASPSDSATMDMEYEAYEVWYADAIRACLHATHPDGVMTLTCTDRKHDGVWLSKPRIAMRTARTEGFNLLWHKLRLHRDPGKINLHRPAYSHVLSFGRHNRPGKPLPDAWMDGPKLYRDGIGMRSASLMVTHAARYGHPIVDPFCGRGTLTLVAAAAGIPSIGVDLDPAVVEAAMNTRTTVEDT